MQDNSHILDVLSELLREFHRVGVRIMLRWALGLVLAAPIIGFVIGRLFSSDSGAGGGMNFLSVASLIVGLAGLTLVGLITCAGLIARHNRLMLLKVFRPGLYITAFCLMGLVCIHAVILIMSIYIGESALIGRIHIGILIAIGLGAFLGVAAICHGIFGVVQETEIAVIGKCCSPQEVPELWRTVEKNAKHLSALVPQHIVLGLDPTFFVTEANILALDGRVTGRTLYCSLPLARILTKEEFIGVLGHELAHFRGLDTSFSERFYPIYRGSTKSLGLLKASIDAGGWHRFVLMPAFAILGYFLEMFTIAERKIGREREFIADAAGAGISAPRIMASALVKIHAYAYLWQQVQELVSIALNEGRIIVNLSKTYAEKVTAAAISSLNDIPDREMSHPTDTHPSLNARLQSLGVESDSVVAASCEVTPPDNASLLVQEVEKIEEAIGDTYQRQIARHLGIELNAEKQGPAPRIPRCLHCGIKVIPLKNGNCPSCGAAIRRENALK